MKNQFEKITPYSEIKDTVLKAGLDNETLANLAQKGLHPNMSRMLAFNHGLNAKDLQQKVSDYSDKAKNNRELLSLIYKETVGKSSPKDLEKNEKIKADIQIQVDQSKSDSFEKIISEYLVNSKFLINDSTFHMVYGNQDWNLLHKDPEEVLNLYETHKEEIESYLQGIKKPEIWQGLHSLGCYPEFNNEKILKTRLFIKSKANELTKAFQVKEKDIDKSEDSQLTKKYSKQKSKAKEQELEME